MPRISLGITGLSETWGRDDGMEEPYQGQYQGLSSGKFLESLSLDTSRASLQGDILGGYVGSCGSDPQTPQGLNVSSSINFPLQAKADNTIKRHLVKYSLELFS